MLEYPLSKVEQQEYGLKLVERMEAWIECCNFWREVSTVQINRWILEFMGVIDNEIGFYNISRLNKTQTMLYLYH